MKNNYSYLLTFAMVAMLSIGFVSCSNDDDDNHYNKYTALFSKTDSYVKKLKTSSSLMDSSNTSDGKYTVTVFGRLIIVKKNNISGESYSEIKTALKDHYKNEYSVNDVYLNNGGTVTIDCRK